MADGIWVDLDIQTDPTELQELAIDHLQSELGDDWEPSAANLEVIICEISAALASEAADVASVVSADLFKIFGMDIAGVEPIQGRSATGQVTILLTDDDGHTIPAGTVLEISDFGFETVEDVEVAAASSSTGVGEVEIIALDEGVDRNGLTGPVNLIDTLSYIDSVSLVGTTSGGVDAELIEDYRDRLVRALQLMSPTVIVPSDYETLIRDQVPGVARVLALDEYDPADDTYGNERMLTLYMIDALGEEVDADVKAEAQALIDPLRQVSMIINWDDPVDYDTVDVTVEVAKLPAWDADAVQTQVEDIITAYLSPANWGLPDSGDVAAWVAASEVNYLNLAARIKGGRGVAFLNTLTIEGVAGDYTLVGDGGILTRPGTITVTVV